MRAWWALSATVIRRHSRSVWMLLPLAAFVVLTQALPMEAGASLPELRRQKLAAILNAAALVLGCCALALPAAVLAERRGIQWMGGLSGVARDAALWWGLTGVLLLLGCLLGVAGALILHGSVGISDRAGEGAALHESLDCGPEHPVLMKETLLLPIALPGESDAPRRFEVRLRPIVRVLDDAVAPQSLLVPLSVRVLTEAGRVIETESLTLRPQGAVRVRVEAPPGISRLQLELKAPPRGLGLEMDHASVQLRAGAASLLASVLRGVLGLALLSGALCAATLWFSGFTAHPLAVLAVITALLAAALAPWESVDLVARVRAGAEIGWRELSTCAVGCAASLGFVLLGCLRDRRVGRSA